MRTLKSSSGRLGLPEHWKYSRSHCQRPSWQIIENSKAMQMTPDFGHGRPAKLPRRSELVMVGQPAPQSFHPTTHFESGSDWHEAASTSEANATRQRAIRTAPLCASGAPGSIPVSGPCAEDGHDVEQAQRAAVAGKGLDACIGEQVEGVPGRAHQIQDQRQLAAEGHRPQ
jgi:hypothetical protein